ncbi:unnamed protein product [Trichobilharzia regenti]|nr:unnamed protein product [Trichobilharzia regenti]
MSKHMSLLADLKTTVEKQRALQGNVISLDSYSARMQLGQLFSPYAGKLILFCLFTYRFICIYNSNELLKDCLLYSKLNFLIY